MAVALVGCHTPAPSEERCPEASPHSELASIDTLMQSHPDSALAMLLDTSFDEPYYQLLLSEALYKNDYAQANRTELLAAMAYYDSLGGRDGVHTVSTNDAFLAARCHYMNGVGYYETDSVVSACAEYLKALEIMEKRFKEKDLVGHKAKFMALTHTHLCGLFSDQYLHEQAIYFGKSSLNFNGLYQPVLRHTAWILNEIGSQYEMLGVLDSAEYYYLKGINLLPDTNNITYRDLTVRLAFLSYENGQEYNISMNQIKTLLKQSDNQKEFLSRCLTIGEMFFHEKQYDSAFVYLYNVFYESQSKNSKKQAAEWLVEICKHQGKSYDVYANYLVPFANQEENQSAVKSHLAELYKSYDQQKREYLHQQQKEKGLTRTLMVVVVFIIVITLILFLYYTNQKKKQLLEEQIKVERQSHEIQQKSLCGKLKNNRKALREAQEQIERFEEIERNNSENPNQLPGKERYEQFKSCPICMEILGRVSQLHSDKRIVIKTDVDIRYFKSLGLSEKQLIQLITALDSFFPELVTSIKRKTTSLRQKDWLFLSLYLLQIDKMDMCVLLQESYHTCRRHTLKLEQALDCPHSLTAFLLEQVDAL